jgi:steroid delta-isomerase-like uncharacterized protein
MSTPREVVEQWAAAYNARDASAAADLYVEDASSWQLAAGDPVVGRDAIRAGLGAFFAAFPDSVIRTESLFEAGDAAAWTWIASGTWRGPLFGRQPNGKVYTLRGCTVFETTAGRIRTQQAYWDRATWFLQLGIPL